MAIKQEADGKFAKGHSGGPGRPPKEREQKYSEILLSTVTFADWQRIVEKAAQQAKQGDHVARKWLSDYLVGPPVERKEITGADGAPLEFIEIIRDSAKDGTP